eukprot:CAMPEP_0204644146 /NCGR_PEP_ID=MMETSP0718-20130828/1259_1 /ASSEMBLY_ACC=CAM_ASM_000674 /TAXON_ID=230516 /ORGANISM="Chaetoceros curvisetus" /LENGTH=182 /DNA_ID=CAMNT_0051665611 /DNA_START=47 /DNA_END=595 /DNA_ORIENTATION=-
MAVISKEDDPLTFDITQDESYEFPSVPTSPPVVATPVSSLRTEDHSFQQASSDTRTTDLPTDNNRQIGAGIVAALITLPLFGPFIAAVAGVAAAHGTTQDGAAGDICRAASDVAMTAKDKAIEMDKKHDIVNRSKENARDFVNNVRKGDTHNLLEKIGERLQEVFKVVGQFFDKNRRGRGEE